MIICIFIGIFILGSFFLFSDKDEENVSNADALEQLKKLVAEDAGDEFDNMNDDLDNEYSDGDSS